MSKTSMISAALLSLAAGAAQAIPANISFDGYCDGMTGLTAAGGFVTGQHDFANCIGYTPDPVMGPTGKRLAGNLYKGYSLSEASHAQFGTTFGWTVNSDHTWVVYQVETGAVLNSGTWSAGYPLSGAQAGGRISTQK